MSDIVQAAPCPTGYGAPLTWEEFECDRIGLQREFRSGNLTLDGMTHALIPNATIRM